jgi:hypothetical protein
MLNPTNGPVLFDTEASLVIADAAEHVVSNTTFKKEIVFLVNNENTGTCETLSLPSRHQLPDLTITYQARKTARKISSYYSYNGHYKGQGFDINIRRC